MESHIIFSSGQLIALKVEQKPFDLTEHKNRHSTAVSHQWHHRNDWSRVRRNFNALKYRNKSQQRFFSLSFHKFCRKNFKWRHLTLFKSILCMKSVKIEKKLARTFEIYCFVVTFQVRASEHKKSLIAALKVSAGLSSIM